MILGVDHLALSCHPLNAAVRLMAESGFTEAFTARNVPNAPEKREFLHHYESAHSLSYWKAPAGIAIEITEHSLPLEFSPTPAFQPLFARGLAGVERVELAGENYEAAQRAMRDALGYEAELFAWPKLSTRIWCCRDKAEGPLVQAIVMDVSDFAAAETFWSAGLGFKREKGGRGWVMLQFKSMVPAWSLRVILHECSGGGTRKYLDDAGFPCLALLTNRLESDLGALESHGAHTGRIFRLAPGGKMLNIAVLRGPAAELVELIEVARN